MKTNRYRVEWRITPSWLCLGILRSPKSLQQWYLKDPGRATEAVINPFLSETWKDRVGIYEGESSSATIPILYTPSDFGKIRVYEVNADGTYNRKSPECIIDMSEREADDDGCYYDYDDTGAYARHFLGEAERREKLFAVAGGIVDTQMSQTIGFTMKIRGEFDPERLKAKIIDGVSKDLCPLFDAVHFTYDGMEMAGEGLKSDFSNASKSAVLGFISFPHREIGFRILHEGGQTDKNGNVTYERHRPIATTLTQDDGHGFDDYAIELLDLANIDGDGLDEYLDVIDSYRFETEQGAWIDNSAGEGASQCKAPVRPCDSEDECDDDEFEEEDAETNDVQSRRNRFTALMHNEPVAFLVAVVGVVYLILKAIERFHGGFKLPF